MGENELNVFQDEAIENEKGETFRSYEELRSKIRSNEVNALKLWGYGFVEGRNESTGKSYLSPEKTPGECIDARIYKMTEREITLDICHPTEMDPKHSGRKSWITTFYITPENIGEWKIEL